MICDGNAACSLRFTIINTIIKLTATYFLTNLEQAIYMLVPGSLALAAEHDLFI